MSIAPAPTLTPTTLPAPAAACAPSGGPRSIEEQAYDALPYESRPFGQTQPARLAALARLLGLDPAPVETARVLEIGCASGGNLLGLALRFPNARFTGIDISGRQIAAGQARAELLGLSNLELRQLDIQQLADDAGRFDYIVCHGVYSWVPQPVRDAILRACERHLSEHGVAFVSFNALPGWHFTRPVRDFMLQATEGIAEPARRAARARELLGEIAAVASGHAESIYSHEVRTIADTGDYYVAHDHLEHTNAPSYLVDFAAHAQRHGLAYLSDIVFQTGMPMLYGAPLAAQAERHGDGDVVRTEQYLDFASGRRFREALLVRAPRASAIDRALTPARLDRLHLRLRTTLKAANADPHSPSLRLDLGDTELFRDGYGHVYEARGALARRALHHLAGADENDRSTFTTESLSQAAGGHAATIAEERQELGAVLMALLCRRALRLYASPVACGRSLASHPRAFALALADAAAGAEHTTNLFHESVTLSADQRRLLALLDGSRDRAQLDAALADGAPPSSPAPTLDERLRELARAALLH